MITTASRLTLLLAAFATTAQASPMDSLVGEPDVRYVPKKGLIVHLAMHGKFQTSIDFDGELHRTSGKLTGVEPRILWQNNRVELSVTGSEVSGNVRYDFADRFVIFHVHLARDAGEAVQHLTLVPTTVRELREQKTRCAQQSQEATRDFEQKIDLAFATLTTTQEALHAANARARTISRALVSAETSCKTDALRSQKECEKAVEEERMRRIAAEMRTEEVTAELTAAAGKAEQAERRRHTAERETRAFEARKFLDDIKTPERQRTLFIAEQGQAPSFAGPWKIEVLAGDWNRKGDRVFVALRAETLSNRPFVPRSVQVTTKSGNELPAELVGDDVRVAENVPGFLAIAVRAKRPNNITHIILSDEHGQKAVAVVTGWKAKPFQETRRPRTPRDEYEEWAARMRAREARAVQLILSARLLGGAHWVADGLGADRTEATSLTGLGVYITKGITEMVAFQVELAGVRTGSARFDNMTFMGNQGELSRSATLGRLGLGGVLRFGNRIIPYAQLGVGLQGASYDSAFRTEGTTIDGPDSSFELLSFVTIGGGIAVRFGQNVIVGATASTVQVIAGLSGEPETSGALEAGIYLGYGWNPGKED